MVSEFSYQTRALQNALLSKSLNFPPPPAPTPCARRKLWTVTLVSHIPLASFLLCFACVQSDMLHNKSRMTLSGSGIVGRQSDDSDDSVCIAHSLHSCAVSYVHTVHKLPFITQPLEENIPPGYDVHTINDNSPHVDYSAGWDLTFVPQQGKPAPGHTFHSTAVVNSSLNLHFNGESPA